MKTPYFIFKPEILEKNYKEFESLCEKHLEKFVIAYSVKTNSFKGVIQTLLELGSNFEVASLEEINQTPEKSKIFNGCCKTEEELKIAIENKFLINVDSKSEIDKLNKLLENESFNISLRISLKPSKFGFPESQIKETIEYCKSKNLNVIGFHFHQGTQQNLREFEDNLKRAEKIIKGLKIDIKYLDVGGGFPDKPQLKNLKNELEDYILKIKQYTEKLSAIIILEPGRNLVADCFELITKVHSIKETDQKYAVLDVGTNLLPKITHSTYKFSNLNKEETTKEPKQDYILAGPLLFLNDTLGKFTGHLKEGDLLKVENVGAYCYNLAWEITYKKPEIVTEEKNKNLN